MAKIAMPLAGGFEDSEFSVPYERLKEAGHEVTVFGIQAGLTVMGKRGEVSHRVEVSALRSPMRQDAMPHAQGRRGTARPL